MVLWFGFAGCCGIGVGGCFLVCFSCKLGCVRWLGFGCLDSLGVGFRHVILCVLDGLCFYVFRLSRRFSDFLVWVVGMA